LHDDSIESKLVDEIDVRLENMKTNCDLQWRLNKTLTPEQTINSIPISITVACSLTGSESFVVVFKNPTLIKDIANNAFQQTYLTASASRYSFIPASEGEAVAASGATISAASLLTLGLVIGMVALQ